MCFFCFFVFFCLRLVSCIYVASFCGLSIIDCPLRFSLTFIIFILFLWQSMVIKLVVPSKPHFCQFLDIVLVLNVHEIMAAGLTVINTTINHQLCRRLNKNVVMCRWISVHSLLDSNGCVRVYQRQMERFNDYYVREHDKFGGRRRMVLDEMTSSHIICKNSYLITET